MQFSFVMLYLGDGTVVQLMQLMFDNFSNHCSTLTLGVVYVKFAHLSGNAWVSPFVPVSSHTPKFGLVG